MKKIVIVWRFCGSGERQRDLLCSTSNYLVGCFEIMPQSSPSHSELSLPMLAFSDYRPFAQTANTTGKILDSSHIDNYCSFNLVFADDCCSLQLSLTLVPNKLC